MSKPASHRRRLCSLVGATALAWIALPSVAQPIVGAAGASSQWGSGWMDLAPPMDFKKGDKLRMHLGGSAEVVLVRLLPRGAAPESDTGIVGGALTVPKSRVIDVSLPLDRKQIVQISVHGGPNPWGRFPLGGANGPATITSIELLK